MSRSQHRATRRRWGSGPGGRSGAISKCHPARSIRRLTDAGGLAWSTCPWLSATADQGSRLEGMLKGALATGAQLSGTGPAPQTTGLRTPAAKALRMTSPPAIRLSPSLGPIHIHSSARLRIGKDGDNQSAVPIQGPSPQPMPSTVPVSSDLPSTFTSANKWNSTGGAGYHSVPGALVPAGTRSCVVVPR